MVRESLADSCLRNSSYAVEIDDAKGREGIGGLWQKKEDKGEQVAHAESSFWREKTGAILHPFYIAWSEYTGRLRLSVCFEYFLERGFGTTSI